MHSLLKSFLVGLAQRGGVEGVVIAADLERVTEGLGVGRGDSQEDMVYGGTFDLIQQSHQLAQPGDEHPARNVAALRRQRELSQGEEHVMSLQSKHTKVAKAQEG